MSDFFVVREEGGVFEKIDAVAFCGFLASADKPSAIGVATAWRVERDDKGGLYDLPSGWVCDFNLKHDGSGGFRRSFKHLGAWMEIPEI